MQAPQGLCNLHYALRRFVMVERTLFPSVPTGRIGQVAVHTVSALRPHEGDGSSHDRPHGGSLEARTLVRHREMT